MLRGRLPEDRHPPRLTFRAPQCLAADDAKARRTYIWYSLVGGATATPVASHPRKKMTSLEKATVMVKNKTDAPVVLSTDEARAGVTGHHVRYVLAFGLLGSLIAFLIISLYYGLRLWGADAVAWCDVRRRGNARATACPGRGSIGASCGRDRPLARLVEHGLGTEQSPANA